MNQILPGLMALLMFLLSLFHTAPEARPEKKPDPEPSPIEESAESRYSGMEVGASMLRTESGETAFMAPGADGGFWSGGRGWEELKAASVPNAVSETRTLSAAGVEKLQINASLCGVAVEPSDSGEFELSCVGRSSGLSIAEEAAVENGVLTLTCTGTVDGAAYVNTTPEFRVNTVRLGVPAGVLREIGVDCGAGNVLISGLDVPVTGVETSGIIRVAGETVSAPVELRSQNGSVAVLGDNVTGDVTLSAQNGSVLLVGGAVTGRADLSARNGSVSARADRLENGELRAVNGRVEAEVGVVGEHVRAEVKNGALFFWLTREPENLTFRLSGGWERNAVNGYWNGDKWVDDGQKAGLPAGWHDGYTVGDGKPVLELSAASNGQLGFHVGEKNT